MDSEEAVAELLNDLAGRKGFDATWTSLDKKTRDLIRDKWVDIVEKVEIESPDVPEYLDNKYDHVLAFNEKKMQLSQLARIDDYSLNQRICVNRNLHNGKTRHIEISAKIKSGDIIFIAGDEVA